MPQRVQRNGMRDRVSAALNRAPSIVPARFEDAYRRGGIPTSLHLTAIAAAAGTTPIRLMTGWPTAHALPNPERTSP